MQDVCVCVCVCARARVDMQEAGMEGLGVYHTSLICRAALRSAVGSMLPGSRGVGVGTGWRVGGRKGGSAERERRGKTEMAGRIELGIEKGRT